VRRSPRQWLLSCVTSNGSGKSERAFPNPEKVNLSELKQAKGFGLVFDMHYCDHR